MRELAVFMTREMLRQPEVFRLLSLLWLTREAEEKRERLARLDAMSPAEFLAYDTGEIGRAGP